MPARRSTGSLAEDLARGNSVDLELIRRTDAELEKLRRAGVGETSEFSVSPPIGIYSSPENRISRIVIVGGIGQAK